MANVEKLLADSFEGTVFERLTADNIESYLHQTAYLISRNELITCEIENIPPAKGSFGTSRPDLNNRIQIKTRKVYVEVNR